MIVSIVLTAVNICIISIVWYRLGRQSVMRDLFKAYKDVCEDNECKQIIINCLKDKLSKYEKEEERHD